LVKNIGVAGLRQNIFKLIAQEVPGAQNRMGLQTIAIAGYPGKDGEQDVALLVNSANGYAEELLDHSCALRG
jgi:CDP-diacylglycerol pyrophosphatase